MAKAIRDGLAELAGAAMTHSRYETSKKILRHTRPDSQATQLVKIAVEWAQQQCRWHESVLTNVRTVFPHFEACGLKLF
eukprot:855205-Ditylum_brightwellii.AAC.2